MPLANAGERAGLLSAFYVEGYLAFSLPAVLAGFLAPIVGLPLAADIYRAAAMLMAVASLLATGSFARRAIEIPRGFTAFRPSRSVTTIQWTRFTKIDFRGLFRALNARNIPSSGPAKPPKTAAPTVLEAHGGFPNWLKASRQSPNRTMLTAVAKRYASNTRHKVRRLYRTKHETTIGATYSVDNVKTIIASNQRARMRGWTITPRLAMGHRFAAQVIGGRGTTIQESHRYAFSAS